MDMTQNEVEFYFRTFQLFYTVSHLTEELGVSRPTVERWLTNETRPSAKHRQKIQRVFDDLIDGLYDKGGVPRKIGEMLDALPHPKPDHKSDHLNSRRANIQSLLLEVMGDHKEHRSADIIAPLILKGYTRINIQVAATHLGVEKVHYGKGPKSYSMWRLP